MSGLSGATNLPESSPDPLLTHPKLVATAKNASRTDAVLTLCKSFNWDISVLEWHLYSYPHPGDPRNTVIRRTMIPPPI